MNGSNTTVVGGVKIDPTDTLAVVWAKKLRLWAATAKLVKIVLHFGVSGSSVEEEEKDEDEQQQQHRANDRIWLSASRKFCAKFEHYSAAKNALESSIQV